MLIEVHFFNHVLTELNYLDIFLIFSRNRVNSHFRGNDLLFIIRTFCKIWNVLNNFSTCLEQSILIWLMSFRSNHIGWSLGWALRLIILVRIFIIHDFCKFFELRNFIDKWFSYLHVMYLLASKLLLLSILWFVIHFLSNSLLWLILQCGWHIIHYFLI